MLTTYYQGRCRQDVNIPPRPTPPHHVYIYKRKNEIKRTGHPARRQQLPIGHWLNRITYVLSGKTLNHASSDECHGYHG